LIAMQTFPYLRPQWGTAAFHRRHWRGWARELAPSLLLLGLLSGIALGLGWPLWVGLGWCGLLPALLVPWALGRRLGGHSGDSYGACVEWTQSLCLLLWGLLLLWGR
jgi:adenosylcobinamide-GDP ribazoletransferase